MKKVLSLVLVIAMILSSFSFAFAANFEDVEGDYEKAINTLVGLGVVTGYEDGTFKPERIVTRAEMAKLIVEILGYGDLVAGSKSNFADTQGHWADAWIALAAGRGIVVGDGDGNFRPDAQVSYDEAITMIVRALGYTDDCNELKGMTWPTNFKVKAADLKLTKDVKIVGTGADRGGVAQLLFNALEANMVTVDTDGNVNYVKDGEDNKILLNALAKKDRFVVAPKHLDEDDKEYKGDIVDLTPYMYQDIKVFVNDDDEVVYVTKVESDVKVGEFRSYTDKDDQVYIRIDGKNKAYDLAYAKDATTIPVYYNGVEIDMTEAQMEDGDTSIVDLHKADATFVLDDAGDIVAIVANKLTNAARVTNEYNGRTKIEGFALPLDDDDEVDYDKLTVTGEVETLEDIEVDDVIVLFAGGGQKTTSADTEKLVIQVVRDTVEGRITKSNKDGQFYINDKYYTVSQFPKDGFVVGLEGTFFLDHKGQLVALEEDDADEPKDYAVVTEVLDGDYNETAKRVALDAEITLVNATGEEVTFKFDNKAKVGEDYIFDRSKGESDSQTVVDHDDDLKINGKLDEYDVIKYTVNSKGKISKITIEKDDPAIPDDSDKKTDITGKKYVFASNVVVFNLDGTDVEVVDVDKLGDEVHIIASEENKNGEIEMFFVKGLGASDTYAYIVKSEVVWNDDDEKVQGLTAYVDGVEVFYEADDEGVVDLDYVDTATMVLLELDGDVITDVTPVATATAITGAEVNITKVSGDRFRVGAGTEEDPYEWYTLADDVAVYILDDGEFDSVGDADSIYFDAEVTGYAFDEDNAGDNIIEVLFIFEGEEPAGDPDPEDPDPEDLGVVTYISGTKATDLVIQVTDKDGNFRNYKAADGEISAAVVNFLVQDINATTDLGGFEGAGMTFGFASNGAINAVKTVKLANDLTNNIEIPFEGMSLSGKGKALTNVANVDVKANNVTLRDLTAGTVKVAAGVENFDAINAIIATLTLEGGGSDSVHLTNTTVGTINVDAKVRVVLNDTKVTSNVNVTVAGAKVEVEGDSEVKKVTAGAAVEVTGADKVGTVEVKADGVKLDAEPETITLDPGKTVEVDGEEVEQADLDEKEAGKALEDATAAVEAAEAVKITSVARRALAIEEVGKARDLVGDLDPEDYDEGVVAALVARIDAVQAKIDSTVLTETELRDALFIEKLETITLGADIELTKHVNLNNNKGLVLDGNGQTITTVYDGTNPCGLYLASDNITIKNVTITGESKVGIDTKAGTKGLSIIDVTFKGMGIGFYANPEVEGTIENCIFDDLGTGIGYDRSSLSIKNNSFSEIENMYLEIFVYPEEEIDEEEINEILGHNTFDHEIEMEDGMLSGLPRRIIRAR